MALRFALLALALFTGIAGCGGAGGAGTVRPSTPANERAIRGPRVSPPPPRLIAPPPAYGNKIVMAKGDSARAVN